MRVATRRARVIASEPAPLTEQRSGPGRRKSDAPRERVTPMGVDIAVTAHLEKLLHWPDDAVSDIAWAALHELRKLNS